ncbi:MAG: hypothetical protein IJR63_08990 [Synergistaceae bacterium]|nr:hypothetical protein [Synergistaceae bacterium]
MEYLELELLTDKIVCYRYYPEGGGEYGIVSLMRKTGKVIYDKDCPDFASMYRSQAVFRIIDYNETGEFPKKATVMWY